MRREGGRNKLVNGEGERGEMCKGGSEKVEKRRVEGDRKGVGGKAERGRGKEGKDIWRGWEEERDR